MREGVLFEITRDHLETGLCGFPVGYCVTSHLDPQKGLSYIGRPVAELAFRDPIEIIYLLFHGEGGTSDQVTKFYREISKRSSFKNETLEHIHSLPKVGNPMDIFAAAILIVGMLESTGNYREDCLHVIAKLPQIAAIVINNFAKWGETPAFNPDLGYVENFVHMLRFPGERTSELMQAMRLFNVLNLDPGGGSLSAFVGKSVASSLENMYGSLAASMTALAGPREGKGGQACLEFVESLSRELGDQVNPETVAQSIRKKWEQKEPILGFGHPVLRVEDPRATICYQYCQKHFSHHPLIRIAQYLRTQVPRILKEKEKIDAYPHFDAISSVLLEAVGFPNRECHLVLTGMANCVGIAVQIMYERLYARDGKGTCLMRPTYLYKHRV